MASIVAGVTLGTGYAAVTAGQEPAGQRVGEKIDRAVQGVKEGVKDVAADLRGRFAKTRDSVHAWGVESRVYGRLHWDEILNTCAIQATVERDGVATLTGKVPDESAKARAVNLAQETVGVTKVVDGLAIVKPSETTDTPSTKP